MSEIKIEDYHKIKKFLDEKQVSLVAVSKTKPDSVILKLYENGQKLFGENRVQELADKYKRLPKDIEWHMIGHLQRNKVKYIAGFVDMIQSVDSKKLLKEINKEARKNKRMIKCLLQFHIAREDSKYGLSLEVARDILTTSEMSNVSIQGVMGMATFTDEQSIIEKEFKNLDSIYKEIKMQFYKEDENFKYISMGMSGDYKTAIQCGSNMVRLGSVLFGARH
ncbi:MAG: YggS family pyridoxal phosphate-dependent enzyme [Chitinophagales bacterium]|nr:YggS family pyridoxal phosphate-dependent enzyme [Chitinophagales bacterium]